MHLFLLSDSIPPPLSRRPRTMSQFIDLDAQDGFRFPAYVAEPACMSSPV